MGCDEHLWTLYRLKFPSGKSYIGLAKSFEMRMWGHKCASGKKNNLPVYNAIRKYGWDSVRKEIICKAPLSEIFGLEKDFVEKENTLVPNGYNAIPGGKFIPSLSKDVAKKVSETKRGTPLTEAHKKALSLAWKTRPPISDKTRAKLSLAGLGRKVSAETRKKISLRTRGRKLSEETRKKIGNRPYFVTPESRAKMSVSAALAWAKRKKNKKTN